MNITEKPGAELLNETCIFRVWAPLLRSVDLVLIRPYNKIIKMKPDDKGFWSASVTGIPDGSLYKYRLNRKLVLPDPASKSQPEGVHGPSEVIDLTKFRWTDSGWNGIPSEQMIFYELHTGTFSEKGNFSGIIHRLDHLIDLGINTIELMPVSQFPGKRNWGYDAVFPYAVQNTYGGPFGLMNLVDACHNAGLAVFLDVIYNHLGPEGNYLGNFAPYFTDRYKTPWGKAVNFDDSYADGVRSYFLQNALMWLDDFHIDGLRLDAVHAIYDFSAKHIMQEMSENVGILDEKSGRKHYLMAESALNDSRYINSIKTGGYGLDAQWNDDFHHALHALSTGERNGYYQDFYDPDTFSKAFLNGFAYDGQYSRYRKRSFGNSSINNPGYQFIVYSQNHDQTGNRKSGERLSTLVSFEMLKVIAGMVLMSPYLPLLFMGEEYAENNPFLYFVDHTDEKLRNLVRAGRRKEFRSFYPEDNTPAPDPSDIETFIKSRLSNKPLLNERSRVMFSYYKALIKLRKTNRVLKQPDKRNTNLYHTDKAYVIERTHGNEKLLICANFSNQASEIELKGICEINKFLLLINSSSKEWGGPDHQTYTGILNKSAIRISKESIKIYSIKS